ncbi:MAG: DUF4238 domain-containing protein [bacterium]
MALHHFVPQFYLKNFAVDAGRTTVWVYRRQGRTQKLPIKSVAAVQGFYEVTIARTGEKSEIVEQLFAKIEGETKPLLDRILSAQSPIDLTGEEYSLLSWFMALLYLRGRSFRAKAHNLDIQLLKALLIEDAKDIDRFKAAANESGLTFDGEHKIEEARKLIHDFDNNFTIKPKRGEEGMLLSVIFENSHSVAEKIFNKTWRLCDSPEKIFVTSDNPLTLMQYRTTAPEQVEGFLTGIIALPLSPFRCLLLEPGPIRRRLELSNLTRAAANNVNQSTMFNAHREVYSKFYSKVSGRAFQKTVEGASEELVGPGAEAVLKLAERLAKSRDDE